jgi:hypothetical protein
MEAFWNPQKQIITCRIPATFTLINAFGNYVHRCAVDFAISAIAALFRTKFSKIEAKFFSD